MMEILKLVMFLLICAIRGGSTQSLPCHTASGDNCTSSICPNTVVTYTCTISGTPSGATEWILPTGTCTTNTVPDRIVLNQASMQGCLAQGSSMCGSYYRANSTLPSSGTACLSSTLTVNIVADVDGNTVRCNNTNSLAAQSTLVSMTTINVVGPPGAPSVSMANTIGPDMVQVVVNPSFSGGLPTSYNVTINNSSYVYSNTTPAFPNGSAMIIFTGLTNSSYYTILSVAINCAGSSNSTTIYISWSAPSPSASTTSSPSIPTTTPTLTGAPGTTTTEDLGVIIGAVIGGVVFIILSVIAIILLYCLWKTFKSHDEKDGGVRAHLSKDGKVGSDVNLELQESHSEQGNVEPVLPPRDCNVFEALYEGAVGGNVPTGNVDDSKYSTVNTIKKNMEKTMYAAVEVGPASGEAPASGKARGRVLPPTSTDHQGVLYSSVAPPSR